MTPRLRLFITLCAFAFWIGGVTFYAAFVVPSGARVLGSHLDFGFITQQVTRYINLTAAVALGIFFWNLLASRPRGRVSRIMLASWLVLLALQGVLFLLHPYMAARMEPEHQSLLGPQEFYALHRIYLLCTTAQVAASLVYLWCCLTPPAPGDRT